MNTECVKYMNQAFAMGVMDGIKDGVCISILTFAFYTFFILIIEAFCKPFYNHLTKEEPVATREPVATGQPVATREPVATGQTVENNKKTN